MTSWFYVDPAATSILGLESSLLWPWLPPHPTIESQCWRNWTDPFVNQQKSCSNTQSQIALEQKLTGRIVSPESLDQICESGTTCYSIPFVATLCKTHSFPVTWSLSKETWRRLRKLPNQTSLAGQKFLPRHQTLHNYQVFHLIAWRVMFFGFQLMTPWLMQELMFYWQDCHFCLKKKEGQESRTAHAAKRCFSKARPEGQCSRCWGLPLSQASWSQCTLEK